MKTQEKPRISDTSFGSITVDGERYNHDIIITLEGRVKKRRKKLSKEVYGSSHTISLPEIEFVYQEDAEGIIIGSGQYGVARLSKEAWDFMADRQCRVVLKNTPEALQDWNSLKGKWLGLFHITC